MGGRGGRSRLAENQALPAAQGAGAGQRPGGPVLGHSLTLARGGPNCGSRHESAGPSFCLLLRSIFHGGLVWESLGA